MTKPVVDIVVLTGDHTAPDVNKPGAKYNPEDLVTHEAMVAAFKSLPGYRFEIWNDHTDLIDRLRTTKPDLVVNFCDTGYRNIITQEPHIPALLELLDIPCTGAPPAGMVMCYDKAVVRMVAEAHGVPVPRETFVPFGDAAPDGPDLYPALIKPNQADGSVGITKDAVVRSRAEAQAYLDKLWPALPGRDALVQEYLPGPEYGLGLIGNPDPTDQLQGFTAFPPLEVDFSGLPKGLNPILSYESKTIPDSPYWTEIKFKRASLPDKSAQDMATWAKILFKRLQLRDYGRFDFRAAADGTIRLMEVNPNPAWANDGKLAFMAGFAGVNYPAMLNMILDTAIARVQRGN